MIKPGAIKGFRFTIYPRPMIRLFALPILCCALSAAAAGTVFTLPAIPAELTAPSDRANYLVLHFWDNIDFDNNTPADTGEKVEQHFADFMSVIPIASYSVAAQAVDSLMKKASSTKESYKTVARIAEKYLYEPESPVYNEEHYLLFLNPIVNSSILNDAEKSRAVYQLQTVMKNRVGCKATDFNFSRVDGTSTSLYGVERRPYTLLMFIDPDCDHCRQTVDLMRSSQTLKKEMERDTLGVVAIYTGDEQDLWNSYAASLPSEWTVGYEPGRIIEDDIYALPIYPTIYLLDENMIVVAKNISFSQDLLLQLMHRQPQM